MIACILVYSMLLYRSDKRFSMQSFIVQVFEKFLFTVMKIQMCIILATTDFQVNLHTQVCLEQEVIIYGLNKF